MSPDDEAFVERLRAAYTPPPMTSFDTTRFDARLRARIDASARRRRFALGGLALAAAAVVAFVVAPPAVTPPAPAVDWLGALTAETSDWLGEGTLPSDPLAVPTLSLPAVASAAVDDGADVADDPSDDDLDDGATSPEWMPAEYETLAMLIDVEPYAPEEDWP